MNRLPLVCFVVSPGTLNVCEGLITTHTTIVTHAGNVGFLDRTVKLYDVKVVALGQMASEQLMQTDLREFYMLNEFDDESLERCRGYINA